MVPLATPMSLLRCLIPPLLLLLTASAGAEQALDGVALVDDRARREAGAEVDEARAVVRTSLVAAGEHAFALGTQELCCSVALFI